MGLKQSIIIVNEFSVPLPGGKGSRGATPGAYVERYMARDQATESLAPIQRLRTDDFILRYMARESAVERPGLSRSEIKNEMKQAQGNGGVAFGYGTVSLSDEQLRAASKDIQQHFEHGSTVMKTVLSFDESYLKKHGIVADDFTLSQAGDYRGHLDQMKLRLAIMHGLDRMSSGTSGFDDLRYVGVIQVDTEHVHCHLAMVDAGAGRRAKDGTQRGKLLDRHKSRLRRGVDAWLDEKQTVKHLSSAVGYERRNVTTFIKRWAHERIRAESLPQFLLACLPADRRLWRAGSNDTRMRKPNQLVTELVLEQLSAPDSPLPAAMERVTDYANERREAENLSAAAWEKLVGDGREQILERSVNAVYTMLRALPAEELTVRTPMLEVMSMDYDQMAQLVSQRGAVAEQDLVSFGFRLRSYASRLQHHRDRTATFHDLRRQWERAEVATVVAEDSRPLYDFYRFEEEYHLKLVSKYQSFLPLLNGTQVWQGRASEVTEYGQRLLSLQALRADASLQRMKDSSEAETLGRQIYGQPGGRHLTDGARGRAVLDARIRTMATVYDTRVADLRTELAAAGLVLRGQVVGDEAGADRRGEALIVRPGLLHPFDEVKSLDLHHLGFDFVTDVEIGERSRRLFVTEATTRRRKLLAAMGYLEGSGQATAINDLPVEDVAAMAKLARQISRSAAGRQSVLPSRIAQLQAERDASVQQRRSAATTLDAGLVLRVQAQVHEAVREVDASSFDKPDSRTGGLTGEVEHS